ncbi:helix-turn-helix domain-containing protein [uncultured Pseudoteredinibacter sp.]|uniref:winged helix-turn-helix transcriptional regulator n=1 Tax=uncultured Pseudoteredinibacter sp. TaxID=1641701 RepID=UPI002619413E|nr:helix-turn-helix domain-containing protein [uncultured Pseudoteredinibacter sp.]
MSTNNSSRPIMRLLDVLGQKWALRILWELRNEPMNFRQLQARCDDLSPTSLNRRLKELRELGIVEHDEEGFAYSSAGAELVEQLLQLNIWADKNL